jgi:preprotein translocase subunit SecD
MALELKDCAVNLSSIDYQPSIGGTILIVVFGKMTNNGVTKKFTQTFILDEQPNGYYVRNDIFRYLSEEKEVKEEMEQVVVEEKVVEKAVEKAVESPAEEVEKIVEECVEEPVVEEETETKWPVEEAVEDKEEETVEKIEKTIEIEAESEKEVKSSWAKLAANESVKWGTDLAPVKQPVASISAKEAPHPPKHRRKANNENNENKPQNEQHLYMIYIKNVPEAKDQELQETFKAFGLIKKVEINKVNDYCGRLLKGNAIIEFASKDDVKKAIGHRFKIDEEEFVAQERHAKVNSRPKRGSGNRRQSSGRSFKGKTAPISNKV